MIENIGTYTPQGCKLEIKLNLDDSCQFFSFIGNQKFTAPTAAALKVKLKEAIDKLKENPDLLVWIPVIEAELYSPYYNENKSFSVRKRLMTRFNGHWYHCDMDTKKKDRYANMSIASLPVEKDPPCSDDGTLYFPYSKETENKINSISSKMSALDIRMDEVMQSTTDPVKTLDNWDNFFDSKDLSKL